MNMSFEEFEHRICLMFEKSSKDQDALLKHLQLLREQLDQLTTELANVHKRLNALERSKSTRR